MEGSSSCPECRYAKTETALLQIAPDPAVTELEARIEELVHPPPTPSVLNCHAKNGEDKRAFLDITIFPENVTLSIPYGVKEVYIGAIAFINKAMETNEKKQDIQNKGASSKDSRYHPSWCMCIDRQACGAFDSVALIGGT